MTVALSDYLTGLVSVSWGAETRRVWVLQFNNLPYTIPAGHLRALQYANGVGFPGQWVLDQSDNSPTWLNYKVSSGASSTQSAIPVPIRALLPNESIVPNLFSALVVKSPTSGGLGPISSCAISKDVVDMIKATSDSVAVIDVKLNRMMKAAGVVD